MINQYLKLILRILKKEKVFSVINITGLSIGLACAFIILLFIITELTFDMSHKNRDNIHLLCTNYLKFDATVDFASYSLSDNAIEETPQLEAISRNIKIENFYIKSDNQFFKESKLNGVDLGFFKIFDFPLKYGDYETCLRDNYNILITESIAKKYFGKSNALGQELDISLHDSIYSFTVMGVLKDMPVNSTIKSDFFVNAEIGLYMKLTERTRNPNLKNYKVDWLRNTVETWILPKKGQNIDETLEVLSKVTNVHLPEDNKIKYESDCLNEKHFNNWGGIYGNKQYLRIFSSIGLLILIIVSINYIILSIAKSTKRSKEISIRKVAGASRKNIIQLVLGESVLISLITLPIAITLAELVLPIINQKLALDLKFDYLNNWIFSLSAILLTIIIGTISGSYVAFYLSKFNPIQILKGTQKKGASVPVLRKVLLVLQISIFIFLLVCSTGIQRQFYHIKNMPRGFNKENVFLIDLSDKNVKQNVSNFIAELYKIPGVKYVGAGSGCPPSGSLYAKTVEETDIFYINTIGEYCNAYEFVLNEGRYFNGETSDQSSVLVTKTAVKELELINPVGQIIDGKTIIGVLEDFHYSASGKKMEIVIYNTHESINTLALKLENKINIHTLESIESCWRQFVKLDKLNIASIDETLEYRYRDEYRFKAIINGFTILAIFLASMGLFGSSLFMAEQRAKEIGIRKVFGSKNRQILYIFNKQFISYAIIAMLFAFPIGYYVMKNWLENFHKRITLTPVEFIVSGILGILIILITISYISIKYSRANPVDSLRYE